ncbi:MAG: DUF11 domain-containing protein [Pirellulales bacterium]|nr:DUF11 domain-containing protein [Pirellulales bacterium]
MKRLLLRIAALGTVVILGLIAIAQAQRRTADPASADEVTITNPANPASSAADLSSGTADRSTAAGQDGAPSAGQGRAAAGHMNTLRPPTETAAEPPTERPIPIPSVVEGNPYRQPVSLTSGSETVPPSAIAMPERRTASAPAAPTTGEQPSVPNPFAGRSGPNRSAAALEEDDRYTARAALGAEPGHFIAPGAQPVQTVGVDAASTDPDASADAPDALAAATKSPVVDRYPLPPAATTAAGSPGAPDMSPFANRAGLPAPGDGSLHQAAPPDRYATADAAAFSSEGTGEPGSKQLEGPQAPQLTIQKTAPDEIQVGRPATFHLVVRNTGQVAADEVHLRDEIPKGTRLISTMPRATRGARGELLWELGTVKPGDESKIEIQLMPTATGEIGSVATVSFSAGASARTVATKPELVVKTLAPAKVLIGEEVALKIEISNPGSGKATGVVLEEHIPNGLQHPAGNNLEYVIGDLPPGETRQLELTLVASGAGTITNVLVARDDGTLRTEDRFNLEVIAPDLDVAVTGPKRRYLEREAVYTFSVSNPGTAPAEEVELVAYLPSGLKFVSANNAGHYEETNRTVHWRLEELPMQETGEVQLIAMPVEAGQQNLRLRGTAAKGLADEDEQPVMVEGIAAIMFEVIDVNDPVEVGGETTYEVRVLNQGSKAATNVLLELNLPAQLRVLDAEGPTRHRVQGGRILFEPLSRLAPKADTTYRVRVQGIQAGDLRVPVQLSTDEMREPVTKEESTRVYADE